MKNSSEYEAYFKQMAIDHVEILHDDDSNPHFYLADISEIVTELRSGFDQYVVILEHYEAYGQDNNTEFKTKQKTGAIMILKHVSPRDMERSDVTDALDWAESVGWQFMARMDRDSYQVGHDLYHLFTLNDVDIQKVGPLYESYYGYRFEFSWTDKEDIRYDESKWNE